MFDGVLSPPLVNRKAINYFFFQTKPLIWNIRNLFGEKTKLNSTYTQKHLEEHETVLRKYTL